MQARRGTPGQGLDTRSRKGDEEARSLLHCHLGPDRTLTSFVLYFCPPGCLTLTPGLGSGADICFLFSGVAQTPVPLSFDNSNYC